MWGNFAAMVSIYAEDGTVAVTHVGIEMGQGINTKVSLVGIDASKNINASVMICTVFLLETLISTYIHAFMHTYTPTYVHTYVHTHIHTYVHTYIHTHIRTYISPLFCKKGTTDKISILQEKHMTNGLRCRISPTYLCYSWRWTCHFFTYHRGPLVDDLLHIS
jgi:hypothetical protein